MEIKYTEKDASEMVKIPAGPFVFGISDDEILGLYEKRSSLDRYRKEIVELDKETISLPDFFIDRYPVTNKRYSLFLRDNPTFQSPPYLHTSIWGGDNQPVVGISWEEASAFAVWAGKRLPTEQEWEKACRGIDGRLFSWGESLEEIYCNCVESGLDCTSIVGSFPQSASPFGLHDMLGNVWEMTSSDYDQEHKVMKGGSYLTYQVFCRSTARWHPSSSEMKRKPHWLGFRCVMSNTP